MNWFQLIFVPLCTLFAVRSVHRTWRRLVPLRSGLLAIALWGAGAVVIAQPKATAVVAGWLGIGRGADLVFYLAILGGLAVSFYFYQRCRQLEILVTELARRTAIDGATRGDESFGSP
jgi:hypothetical protein